MYDIVNTEHRPFCRDDFCPAFTVDGKTYPIAKGTFRNIICKFKKEGLIEHAYSSFLAFYTIRGIAFTPKGKAQRAIASGGPIQEMLGGLSLGGRALHDIRLRCKVEGIWRILSSDSRLAVNPTSKDLAFEGITYGDVAFKVVIHRTDTVSVTVECSMNPIAADVSGLILLTEYLTRLEEHIQSTIRQAGMLLNVEAAPRVPRHPTWIVTMWHFGRDSLTEYTGEKFHITWNEGREGLLRAYAKDMKHQGTRIRLERQEYPGRSFAEAIEEKLDDGSGRGLE